MSALTHPRRLLAACLVVGLAACSAASPSGVGTEAASIPTPTSTAPADTALVFVSVADSPYDPASAPMISDVRVAGPDGSDPRTVIPHEAQVGHVWASSDGSVLAYQQPPPGHTRFDDIPDIWIVSPLGRVRLPRPTRPRTVAAVAPDGHAVYATDLADVVKYTVATGAVTTLCTGCVTWTKWSVQLAVSEDESRVATTSRVGGPDEGYLVTVEVFDTATSKRVWSSAGHTISGWGAGKAEPLPTIAAFVDDTTVVDLLCCDAEGNREIHLVSGLGSGHVVDRKTGVAGLGPITRLRGLWWYSRSSWNHVTSIYTNPDLTPAHETKVADRVDGTTSWDYQPVTSWPTTLPEPYPSPPPSSKPSS